MTTTSATGSKTKGIIALVAGVVSLIGAFAFAPLGIVAGIVAVILGVLSRRSEPGARGLALAGLILGVVGIVLSVIFLILAGMLIASMGTPAGA
ncbi:MAG TPA: hypothetical protein VIL55_01800 [Naasia sp.]